MGWKNWALVDQTKIGIDSDNKRIKRSRVVLKKNSPQQDPR